MKDETEIRIRSFLARYSPEIGAQLQEARSRLRAFFPRGFELVFDNYNALVFGFSPSDKASQSIVSIAGYPRWITLFFLHGVKLDDPHRLLEGNGTQVRGIRLPTAAAVDSAKVRTLLKQAVAPLADEFRSAPALTTIVKLVAAKQRARRPATREVSLRKTVAPAKRSGNGS